ncbi:gluconate transporter [Modestobacter sp. I12A-02628]|uniref:Gluconate transporter n=1 Tax=Goekera deserti TaxID=2497753 RepID=A0A7K3W9H0_9ACTN|nr:gluconate:H+ symporter [Goekera deserti]MPQ98797.1 gluconate transporter [Goekera deserti]NDI49705.1 gluconate transporter [Goekera deserti]NEL53102.1 gluconate transporter [Goekera deserti]
MTLLAAARPTVLAAEVDHTGSSALLVTAALVGIAVVVVLITVLKVHPFLALILGSAALGALAGVAPADIVTSFTAGVGSTVGSVGLLIALGAMIGGLLTASGGADRVVTAIVDRVGPRALPWAMGGVAALIGIPLFFEIGVVLLIPIVLLVARRSGQPVLTVGIPALAGLSVLHGFVPPHPGPLVAIDALGADLGLVLLFGLVLSVPAVVIAGPLFGSFIADRVHVATPRALVGAAAGTRETGTAGAGGSDEQDLGDTGEPVDEHPRRQPGFGATVATVLLPVVLMMLGAVGELTLDEGGALRSVADVLGTPVIALLIGLLVAMVTLGTAVGFGREKVSDTVGGALPAIAGILLIVAAGGGFKQLLVDSGISGLIADAAEGASLSPLVLGWLVAVAIRLATGSATVATITAAGIVAPLAEGLDQPTVALLALAVGAGSLFFSHVNDAGFWLVKEYFGMTVGETIRTWSVMETLISVVGLAGVLLLSLVV